MLNTFSAKIIKFDCNKFFTIQMPNFSKNKFNDIGDQLK